MENPRKYGRPPFTAALIHGGPGAAGEMAPVALVLAPGLGVLEPLQTSASIDGQIEELKALLALNAGGPVALAGFSWGAWLSVMFAARYPDMVKKLILISSGPFEEKYAAGLGSARLKSLGKRDRKLFAELTEALENPAAEDKNGTLARLGALISKADSYAPKPQVPGEKEAIECDFNIYRGVWNEAVELRRGGKLLACAKAVRCPVAAIHGDHDPHPAEGVAQPLSAVLKDFRFMLLKRCGHKPWIEALAKDEFYKILKAELSFP
ncbi:MAG: alpha/beta hydrolase [Elusimicrobia bacterium]|nr:alpha/beta hydrolase [Elusimicrobiota bacterium]